MMVQQSPVKALERYSTFAFIDEMQDIEGNVELEETAYPCFIHDN